FRRSRHPRRSALMGRAAQRLDVRPPTEALVAEVIADQDFGNLDGVECRTLAQIVGDHPQIEPVRDSRIAPDTADIDRILAGRLLRSHIAFVGAVVDDHDTWRARQGGTRAVLTERPLELDIDRLP